MRGIAASVKRVASRAVHTEAKIASLGLQLPVANVPKGPFVNFTVVGNIAYVSGHLPQMADGTLVVGKVGKDISPEDAYEAAKGVGLNILATAQSALDGNLDGVRRVLKLTGFVNAIEGYSSPPVVVNGCSEVFLKVFGEGRGTHTRSAVTVSGLPLGVPVEVEAILELTPEAAAAWTAKHAADL